MSQPGPQTDQLIFSHVKSSREIHEVQLKQHVYNYLRRANAQQLAPNILPSNYTYPNDCNIHITKSAIGDYQVSIESLALCLLPDNISTFNFSLTTEQMKILSRLEHLECEKESKNEREIKNKKSPSKKK